MAMFEDVHLLRRFFGTLRPNTSGPLPPERPRLAHSGSITDHYHRFLDESSLELRMTDLLPSEYTLVLYTRFPGRQVTPLELKDLPIAFLVSRVCPCSVGSGEISNIANIASEYQDIATDPEDTGAFPGQDDPDEDDDEEEEDCPGFHFVTFTDDPAFLLNNTRSIRLLGRYLDPSIPADSSNAPRLITGQDLLEVATANKAELCLEGNVLVLDPLNQAAFQDFVSRLCNDQSRSVGPYSSETLGDPDIWRAPVHRGTDIAASVKARLY